MFRTFSKKQSGFTLIELLVVISIILIAASVIIIGTGGGDGAALSSSKRIVSGIVQGARGQAILKNQRTRLIIHNDPSDVDKFRRFFGIVYEGETENTWIAATQGTYLPEGIYFDAETSADESGSWAKPTMTIDFPRTVAQSAGGGSTEFLYYEFNSNGTTNTETQNAWLVLRAATMIPDESGVSELRVEPEKEGLKTALIVRRSGNATSVDEPSAITVSGDIVIE